jgi:hypothetical protein
LETASFHLNIYYAAFRVREVNIKKMENLIPKIVWYTTNDMIETIKIRLFYNSKLLAV